jgi:hypothetical protein
MFLPMMALLPRSRALALVLLLLAPGISGSAVQWLHACPAQAAAVTDHQHHGQAPADAERPHQTCHCIGTCNPAGTASPSKSITVAVAVIQPYHHVVPPTGISFIPLGTPADLLPPATAPPLV